ncbi:MAG: hypothetical protein JOZ24_08800 [Candidatus Eremiobacteraeota bacterium]|nr:hypothetical protein [Candidatus Eremiobacteraeota bacterium]
MPPWLFTVPVPCDAAADDAFVLAPAGPRYRLALGRTHFPGEDPHCAFLVRLPDGSTRCGLGELRPRTCRDWPLKGPTPLCTCDWSDIAGDDDSPVAEPVQRDVERDRYAGVVAGWNAYVEASGGEQLTHRDFCRHILGAYPAET